MRLILLPVIAAAVMAASMSPGFAARTAARSHGTVPFCAPGRGCINTTNARYNQCYNLAVSRGWSVFRVDDRGRNDFIFLCLAGRIPR